MQTTTQSFTLPVLTPADGYMLTPAAETDDLRRFFTDKVYLGSGDSADNWREVPRDEAERVMALQQAEAERQRAEAETAESQPAEA